MEETMNSTDTTLAQDVALLKEAVAILIHRHHGEAYTSWPSAVHLRLIEIINEWGATEVSDD